MDEDTKPARLIIADDHALLRSGIRSMLYGEPDLEVVGEAADGAEALELCRRLQPDLVLMDVRMPKMDGLAATRAIKEEFPRTGVVMVTIDLLRSMVDREQSPASPSGIAAPEESLSEPLTARETEILRLLAQGQTNPQIARELVVSPGTVKSHVRHIIAKLGVSDRTQAAVRAMELGLLASG